MNATRFALPFLLMAMTATAHAASSSCKSNTCATRLNGIVSSGPSTRAEPIERAQVLIYEAREGAPRLLASTRANARGEFSAALPKQGQGVIRYAVAMKGAVEFMTVIAPDDKPTLRINEMTTVASAYAMSQFISGNRISGKPLPLQVAAGMFRNLVSSADGGISQVLVKSPNADETNARRLIATLANILAGCARGRSEAACDPLFDLTTGGSGPPATTLEAAVSIARNPARNVKELFVLGGAEQPYQPALLATQGPDATNYLMRLDAFTLAVKVNATGRQNAQGQELCPFGGPGNLVFDPKGYAWITNNVVQGQTGSASCFIVLKPDGSPSDGADKTPVSPLSGGGVLGQGFGITRDPSGNIWAGNFGWGGVNPVGSVSKFSPQGKALSPSSGYVSTLDRVQGTTSDQAGNIWMASYYGNAVHVFPKGAPFTNYPAFADENTNPFHIVIDDKGAAWVSYTGTSALSKFTYTKRGLVKAFTVPIGSAANPKGIAVDPQGNIWATAGKESKVYAYGPDGSLIGGFSGGGVTGPWGVSSDSNGHIWVANFGPSEQLALTYRLTQLCGANTEKCPAGMRTGDPISPDTGYTLPSAGDPVQLASGQLLYEPLSDPSYKPLMRATATQIDMAGNVWVTNNWKPSGLDDIASNPGGDGIVIFVGIAAPVKPGIGQPKAP